MLRALIHSITHNLGFEGWLELPTLELVPFNGLEEQVTLNVLRSCFRVAPQSMPRMLVQKLRGHSTHGHILHSDMPWSTLYTL